MCLPDSSTTDRMQYILAEYSKFSFSKAGWHLKCSLCPLIHVYMKQRNNLLKIANDVYMCRMFSLSRSTEPLIPDQT